ncbi:MAG: 3-dehydroquinate synthase [Gemmatimonadales bacterium]
MTDPGATPDPAPPAEVVEVRHQTGRYPVLIGAGLLDRLDALAAEHLPGRRLAVITDQNVARAVPHSLKGTVLVVAPGEEAKTRRRWGDLTDQLLELGYGRDAAIVAVGGGVVGDLAGFVAATYLRGVPFLQVPTSLVAMVDASVGGKTGVNTHHGKNLVGAFHQPAAVIADPLALKTLRRADLRGGLIEAFKHGLIADAGYFERMAAESAALLGRDPAALAALVRRSVELKAAIVGQDEREGGVRAVLNAGHTVGHALEHWSEYRLGHGDAVGLGLVVESFLAEALGLAPAGLAAVVGARLAALGLALEFPPAAADGELLDLMRLDKKVREARLRFALPREPGTLAGRPGGWTVEAGDDDVRRALGSARKLAGTVVSTIPGTTTAG